MSVRDFHPAVREWFVSQFSSPTSVQDKAWRAIGREHHTLIAAPTGSGKTLAAFLNAIDRLVCAGLQRPLEDQTLVLYVSPLKALSNDIQKNLQQPLNGIRDKLLEHGLDDVNVRAGVRTGDTPAAERERMRRQPPHIVVTTPESLFLLLTAHSGRAMLTSVRTVIVDEVHALAGTKRGAHLSLSLARLDHLCVSPPVRIGLSATQKPIEDMARFLVGTANGACTIVDAGHVRDRDLALEIPDSPLEAVMAAEVWEEIYDRLGLLIADHRTTLIFVNTRRMAERVAHRLAERMGEEHVTSHHGSLSREHRLRAEQRLKAGDLRALVATASLELGIDIGEVDLVCQLGSPHAIATFLQRVGRSGHAVDATPKGRLFPLSRDDLVECAALLEAVRRDELDRIRIPEAPLDVLAQQMVAELAMGEWPEQALLQQFQRAWPYRDMTPERFGEVARMLAEGFSTRRGRRGAYVHRDRVNGMLRARRHARLVALTNGGAIPDQFDYDVVLQPDGYLVGSLNEDFAFDSLPGDIFQLGNLSYRIRKVDQGKVHVEDARGQPPNIPFWFGEAPGRSDELSQAVSRLRREMQDWLSEGLIATQDRLGARGLPPAAAQQLSEYLGAAKAAFGALPTQDTLVMERFFDEAGDMHLVVHAPFGSRINRAWGLALRKRFCRRFNFELQAAANEDSIVLSLGPSHSFPLEEAARYLRADSVREVLIQALLDAPLFATRWRWNANIALAVPRRRNGRRVPPQFQRSDAEDLVAVVFPEQLACLENIRGEREIPDHPLVEQTLRDCLHEAMDVDGLRQVLRRLETGHMALIARDLAEPSPLASEIINARPYAFLDDAPAEERRTLAVQQRRHIDMQSAADLGRLDTAAIERACQEAWPLIRDADELHDALTVLGFLRPQEMQAQQHARAWLHTLMDERRATELRCAPGETLWVCAERLQELLAIHPQAAAQPALQTLEAGPAPERAAALVEIVRSRLEGLGPVTATRLAHDLGVGEPEVEQSLLALQTEGFAMQGRFRGDESIEWCERGLLARIHRYTLRRLRSEIEPVSAGVYMRFLLHWQGLDRDPAAPSNEGPEALAAALAQLEGLALPAAAWEKEVLSARIAGYHAPWLDQLCAAGRFVWRRGGERRPSVKSSRPSVARRSAPVRVTPIALLPRAHVQAWNAWARTDAAQKPLSGPARQVQQLLQTQGALFVDDMLATGGLLRSQLHDGLAELVALGLATADHFAGLRALIAAPARKRKNGQARRGVELEDGGRWSLLPTPREADREQLQATAEHVARVLLRRYGIVVRAVLEHETGLPPWRELLYVFRRLEARGEIRGGRFVQAFSGEQYALPEAVEQLRRQRRRPDEAWVSISAADPLNLTGVITPGRRVPAVARNRILYRGGIPLAIHVAGRVEFLDPLPPEDEWAARTALLRRHSPATFVPAPSSAAG